MIFCGATMIFALAFSLYYSDDDIMALTISMLATIGIGFLLWYRNRNQISLGVKDGFLLVTCSWIVMTIFGSLPFIISGYIPSFTDAFFETMSGFTTTGASILQTVEQLPHGLLFWRSFTHWLGGMGIIMLSLAILPMLGIGGMQLYRAEVPGPIPDKLSPRLHETAKILWAVYGLISLVLVLILLLGGMSFFDALCHTFAAMATGGFSTHTTSISYFQSVFIEIALVVFMILAGLNFSLHYKALRGNPGCYWKNDETRYFLGIIVFCSIAIALSNYFSGVESLGTAFRNSVFQVVSIITTTGFCTTDFEHWTAFGQIILFVLMFIGGCAGSTAGAIKVMRLVLLVKQSLADLKKYYHPSAVIPVRLDSRAVSPEIVTSVLTFILVFIMVFTLSSLVLTLLGLDLVTAMSAVAATLGNVGPGLGTVGPTDNFGHIPIAGKWLLSFCMLLGRLEIYTVLVIFRSSFWKK